MSPLKERPTSELVVLVLATTVAVLLVASVVFVGVLEITHPDADTSGAISSITNTITLLVGAVVGYLAGRAAKEKTP